VRYNYIWRLGTVLVHTLLWVALAAWSYMTAGDYTFASCFPIIMIYFPPLAFIWLAVGICSFAILITSITRPHFRKNAWFLAACHGMVFAIGLQAFPVAAYAAVET
jgi:hypothetical protein